MDQVKAILKILKKHHFWLLCVICLIAGVVGWTMAARGLSAAYAKRKTEIEGKFKDLDTIEKTQNFPNARWAEEVEKLTKEEKTKVRRTWKGVYDEQAKLLKWPEWTAPPPAEMPLSYREQYATKIGSEFANLLAIIGAESHETSQNAPVVGSAEKKKHDAGHEDRVVWDASSQESVHKKLQLVAPSALEVLLTQEDLWAYQVLLTIIKNINADKYVPPVKEIVTLVVAQKAAEAFEKGLESGIVEMPKAGRAAALGGERAPLAAAAQPGAAAPRPTKGATSTPKANGWPREPRPRSNSNGCRSSSSWSSINEKFPNCWPNAPIRRCPSKFSNCG